MSRIISKITKIKCFFNWLWRFRKNEFIQKICATIIGGFILYSLWAMITGIDTKRIKLYLPYANDYCYKDGRTYKDAHQPKHMAGDVDPKTPIPLNIKKGEQKLTVGVLNNNSKAIENVRLYLTIPDEFEITQYKNWQNYTDKEYNIIVGNINSGEGTSLLPINFNVKKCGDYNIIYRITGKNFKRIKNRVIAFEVYENE